MNTKIKLLFKLLLVTSLFTFSSCEKDLYEDAIQAPERQNKINYVTIDQVPFLIPKIQEFNHDYDYLTQASKTTNKDALYLNLDLNKILEYVTENGLKSYSIKIKNQFEENDDKYFENLNIYEKEGELQSFILKYNSIEDNKEFNFSTFTGEIDLYNLDKDLAGIIQYENGVNKCIKIVIGHWHILDFGGGDIYAWNDGGGGGGSGSGTGSGTGTGGTGTGGSGSSGTGTGSSGSGSSGTGGTGIGNPGGGGTGGSTPVTPNPVTQAEQWIYNLDSGLMSFYSEQFFTLSNEAQTSMINYIIQNNYAGTNLMNAKYFLKSLISNHNGAFNFLASSSVQTQTSVFNYLIQNNFNSSSTNFTNQCITQMMNNPGVFSSITPFLIEKNIDDTQLDPCTKGILNAIKNSTNNDVATIIAKLGNPQSVYNTTIKTEQYAGNDLGQTTHPSLNNYNIKIRTNYVDGTDHDPNSKPTTLSIASTLIHEIIHAYLHSLHDDYIGGTSSTFCDFPMLFDAYVSHTYPGGNPVDAHHEVMANYFVNIIASSLHQFDINNGITNTDSQVYTDLAWSTFSGTPIFEQLYPNTGVVNQDIVRNRILNRRFAEARNQPRGDQNPSGSPCN